MTEPSRVPPGETDGELPIIDLDDFLGFIAAADPTVDEQVAEALTTVGEGYDVLLELVEQNIDRLDQDDWTAERTEQWSATYVATASRIKETSAGTIAPLLAEALAYVTLLYVRVLESVRGDGCGCDGSPLPEVASLDEMMAQYRSMADHNLLQGRESLRRAIINETIKPLDPDTP